MVNRRFHVPQQEFPGLFNPKLFGGLMLVVAILLLISYSASLKGEFVYDDYTTVLENYYITSLRFLPKTLFSSFPPHSNEQGLYRPVLSFSYMLDYFIWGFKPVGFHITNLLLYFLTCGVLYLFLQRLTNNIYIAIFATLIFALHPIHTENVSWISGRAGILSGLFFMISIFLYDLILGKESSHRGLIVAALVSYILAIASYESALMLPVFVLLIDFYRIKEKKLGDIIQTRFYSVYLPLIIVTACFLLIRFMVLGSVGPVGEHQALYDKTLLERLILFPKIIVKNLFILLFPFRLTVIHEPSIQPNFYPLGFWLSALVLVALVALSFATFRRAPFVSLGLFFFLFGIFPRSNIIPVGGIISERSLLLPSIGYCLVVGALLGGYLKREGFLLDHTRNVVLIGVLVAVSMLFLFRTTTRAKHWQTAIGFWQKEAAMNPNSSVAHNSLGYSYYRKREFEKAESAFRTAIEKDSKHYGAYHNLAKLFIEQKRFAEAEKILEQVYAIGSDQGGTNFAIVGGLFVDCRKPERAKEAFQKSLEINPRNHVTLHELGNFTVQDGKYEEALNLYGRALEANPPELFGALVLNNRSIAYEKLGKMEESFRDAQLANKLDPLLPGPYLKLATFYARNNQADRAIALLEQAIKRIKPREFDVYYLLGTLYLSFGLSEKAFNTVNNYRNINPFEPRMYYFLAEVYIQHKQYNKALLAYQQILKFAPKHSQTHALIGNLFARSGDPGKAIEFFKKALEYDANNQFARDRMNELQQSSSEPQTEETKSREKNNSER